jgi:toxin FitB
MDLLIAAIASIHGAAVATRNFRDFDGLGLQLINPFESIANRRE